MHKYLIALILLSGCRRCEDNQTIVIESGTVEILDGGDYQDASDPLPVVVDAGPSIVEPEPETLPMVDDHHVELARPAWRSRCKHGFIAVAGGRILSCRM